MTVFSGPMATISETAKRDSLWAFFGAAACAWLTWKQPGPIAVAGLVLFLAEGILLRRRHKAGAALAVLIPVSLPILMIWLIATQGFSGWRVTFLLLSPLGIWANWSSYGDLLRGKAGWDDPEDADEREHDGGKDPDKPMISIVLLQRRPKFLDPAILLESIRDAWDEHRKLGEDDLFVAGEGPVIMVKSPQGMWMIHNHPAPYFDPDHPARKIPELRLRKIVEEHTAWLAVDLLHAFESELPADLHYPFIFRLIRELADDDTLAIFRPETGEINVWTAEVAARLGSYDPLEEFAKPVHSPVIEVSGDDPRMQAAVAEAQRRFPEFRERWAARAEGEGFLVKASIPKDGREGSEVIWIEVTGLEPDFIHGTLANQPVDLGDLNSGDAVEVPVGNLYDWAIAARDMDAPLGLFTEKVVRAVQQESRRDFQAGGNA
jgi:uncharacterized protein YegJ (DUF2314 family)